jgi:SAM-dependent methyltransferase
MQRPDVSPPEPPAHLLAGVGWGDFWDNGFHLAELIQIGTSLQPDERILDAGCGLGRVTWPLSHLLGENGTYDGIDTVLEYLEWCRNGLGLDPARFRFHLADIYSSFYNPSGTIKPEEFRFPFADGTFTVGIATSLFTHLSAAATVNYLREMARMLAPGGRLFASFFVLDDESREALATGPSAPEFKTPFEHGLLSDPDNPDFAIAFDATWLHQAFLLSGFEIATYAQGLWRRTAGPTHQDVVVARRRPRMQ